MALVEDAALYHRSFAKDPLTVVFLQVLQYRFPFWKQMGNHFAGKSIGSPQRCLWRLSFYCAVPGPWRAYVSCSILSMCNVHVPSMACIAVTCVVKPSNLDETVTDRSLCKIQVRDKKLR